MKTIKKEYSTKELQNEFKVIGFSFGYCAVEHKETKVKGSFDFKSTENGRIYYNFIKA